MFYGKEIGELEEVDRFEKGVGGGESNVGVGLGRLGFRVGWMRKVGGE
nr:PfkB family carbohydrate kinase [Bacillus altitudinis]